MDLLKYLEPMKHLPDRFTNLAFWRGCRKFKDAVVNALEYVDSWGESIESDLDSLKRKQVVMHLISFGDYSQSSTNSDHWYTINFVPGSSEAIAATLIHNTEDEPTIVNNGNVLPFGILTIPCGVVHETGPTIGHHIRLIVFLSLDHEKVHLKSYCPCMSFSIANSDIDKIAYTIPSVDNPTPATLAYFTVE